MWSPVWGASSHEGQRAPGHLGEVGLVPLWMRGGAPRAKGPASCCQGVSVRGGSRGEGRLGPNTAWDPGLEEASRELETQTETLQGRQHGLPRGVRAQERPAIRRAGAGELGDQGLWQEMMFLFLSSGHAC